MVLHPGKNLPKKTGRLPEGGVAGEAVGGGHDGDGGGGERGLAEPQPEPAPRPGPPHQLPHLRAPPNTSRPGQPCAGVRVESAVVVLPMPDAAESGPGRYKVRGAVRGRKGIAVQLLAALGETCRRGKGDWERGCGEWGAGAVGSWCGGDARGRAGGRRAPAAEKRAENTRGRGVACVGGF